MSHKDIDVNRGFLHIKELNEKVRSLLSEVDLNRENSKFRCERTFDGNLSDSMSSDEFEDENYYLDWSEIESRNETNWLTDDNSTPGSVKDVCSLVYADVDENRPEITYLCHQLEAGSVVAPTIFSSQQRASIDSRTFTRPKKCSIKSSLASVTNSDEGRPRLQRRLTTTITPSPNLVSQLEELSKTNNRPVSGNYDDVYWEDGCKESLVEIKKTIPRGKRQSLPASLFDRLQELKRANSTFQISKLGEKEKVNGKTDMLEEAKKVKAALDIDMKNSHSSRLSEIFRNTQDYYSDDNESFISLDEVSGFCDRLTLSTDQNTYSSIVREMEQHEICLFHRPVNSDKPKETRMTFEGTEMRERCISNKRNGDRLYEEDGDLNRTYEIDEESSDNKSSDTFEVKKTTPKQNIMNTTYDANQKPGLMDVILQSDVIKVLPISKNKGCGTINHDDNINNINYKNNINTTSAAAAAAATAPRNNNNDNDGDDYNKNNKNNLINSSNSSSGSSISNNNNININNKMKSGQLGGGNVINYTYHKHNSTFGENELNATHTAKYSTKVFDSSFKEAENLRSSTRRSSGRRDQSDYSEDDCMSTTSDNSCRSGDSNAEAKTCSEEREKKTGIFHQRKKFSSTPITGQMEKLDFDVVSPIKVEMGDGESRAYSNPSSRGQSPRRGAPYEHQDGLQKQRMPNLRQPLKVPQRELKLKPALIRPSQNFKRSLSYARTSSEPSVPQKVDGFQPVASTPALRPPGPANVPSLTNIRPASRASGIPRPPTRLKQPQIRVTHTKK